VFTYPLDIVRTRLSIQSASFAELGDKPEKLPGMWTTLTRMYKTEGGFRALYRGIVPTVAGVAPYVSSQHRFLDLGEACHKETASLPV
jgi:solute carrier family 25 phosphate transporter 23/24/25/41